MRIIANIASIYAFPIQTLTSAILTIAKGKMFRMNPLLNLNANYLDAFHMVRYNFSLIESMWGIRGSGYPNTYYRGSTIAARNDYGKGGKGKKGRKKRKRSRYY
jgi:hypothetical protein